MENKFHCIIAAIKNKDMRYTATCLFAVTVFFNCSIPYEKKNTDAAIINVNTANPYQSIASIPLPPGFTRRKMDEQSFGYWLRQLTLRKDRHVYLYDGSLKSYQQAQFAVIDISTGKSDLQQCADAVMRLRAEYLYATHQIDKIAFIDNDKKVYQCPPNADRTAFEKYLNKVFAACGSYSLNQQLKAKNKFSDIAIGDVLIKGGFPGHAVIVVDLAENNKGEKIYMLAQSYMPAQDIHVLQNFNNDTLSPWYSIKENNVIETPQWTFYRNQLKTW